MKLKIILPLPPKELSPNYTVGSRGGRLGKASKIAKYRHDSKIAGLCSMSGGEIFNWERATIQMTFFFRDKRRRDKDNLLASIKAAADGLQDAGVIANDSGLTFLPVEVAVDRLRNGITLRPPALRLLARMQGLLAGRARLWRR